MDESRPSSDQQLGSKSKYSVFQALFLDSDQLRWTPVASVQTCKTRIWALKI